MTWIACAEWPEDKDVRFTALLHHVDVDRLRAAYWALKPKAAPGVDGVTWKDYGQDLEENLRDLHARVHAGATGRDRRGGCTYQSPTGGAAARGRIVGGQDPSAGGGGGAERYLRVGSGRGAVPALPPVRFPDPLAEPDVPIPEHPALHRTRDGRSCR